MNKEFDPTKPVQTRDGRAARIICTEVEGLADGPEYTIIAIIDGLMETYNAKGRCFPGCPDPRDLVNVPLRREHFSTFENGIMGITWSTLEMAKRNSNPCNTYLRVVLEDGQPVEVELIKG